MRRTPSRFLATLFLILTFAPGALAQTLSAKVTNIVDGDTIVVAWPNNQNQIPLAVNQIRLEGIDAPEHNQAFGDASSKHLSDLVLSKEVNLDCTGGMSYGRLVCKVVLPNGEDVDLEQIKAGLAWHYKQYRKFQSATDRAAYSAAEDAARRAHVGLWSDPHPVQPQDFRHGTQSQLCLDNSDHRIACSENYDGAVRGNRRSMIYHWPGCPNYDDIADHNRVEFPSAIAAEAAGYRAALNCP
jgi:endonuclease YncB( thermonuclease family)